MSKLSAEQVTKVWEKLESQARIIKASNNETVKNEKPLLTQKDKDKALVSACNKGDIQALGKALIAGADLAHPNPKKPFYLELFQEVSDELIEEIFKHGFKEKIRDVNELWKTFLTDNYNILPTFKRLLDEKIYCTDFNIFQKYKDEEDVSFWWEKEGVWLYPQQVNLLNPEKVFDFILNDDYDESEGEKVLTTLDKLKTDYPKEFEKLKEPTAAKNIWLKCFYLSEEKQVPFLCHLIKLGITPPLRCKEETEYSDENEKSLSWVWLALKKQSKPLFDFFIKSQEMRELFVEDLKNHPNETALYCAACHLPNDFKLIKMLKENQFDFTTTDNKKNNYMHHYLSPYSHSKNEINKELNEIIEKNLAFFLKSKNTRRQTMFDIKNEEGNSINVIVKGKKMKLEQYKSILEKKLLSATLPNSNQPIKVKKIRL